MGMDGVFRALSDATRRKLLDRLFGDNGQTLGELCQLWVGDAHHIVGLYSRVKVHGLYLAAALSQNVSNNAVAGPDLKYPFGLKSHNFGNNPRV